VYFGPPAFTRRMLVVTVSVSDGTGSGSGAGLGLFEVAPTSSTECAPVRLTKPTLLILVAERCSERMLQPDAIVTALPPAGVTFTEYLSVERSAEITTR